MSSIGCSIANSALRITGYGMGAIRVAIVGDDRLFRDGLQQILRTDPSLLVTDENENASIASDVDVRLIDARFGHLIAEKTIPTGGRPHVIVVNGPDDDAWAADALVIPSTKKKLSS